MAGSVSDADRALAISATLANAKAVHHMARAASPADVEGLVINFTRQVEHFWLMYFMAGERLRSNPTNETESLMQRACARLIVAAHAAFEIVAGELGLDAAELLQTAAGGQATLEVCALVRPVAEAAVALLDNETRQRESVASFVRAFRGVLS